MDARPIDPSLSFGTLTPSRLAAEFHTRLDGHKPPLDDNLGPFRGLAVAVLLELAFTALGLVAWGLWHVLR